MKATYFASSIHDCLYRLDSEYKSLQDQAGNCNSNVVCMCYRVLFSNMPLLFLDAYARLPDDFSKAVVLHVEHVVPISSIPVVRNSKRKRRLTFGEPKKRGDNNKESQKATLTGLVRVTPQNVVAPERPKRKAIYAIVSDPKSDKLTDLLDTKKFPSKVDIQLSLASSCSSSVFSLSMFSLFQKTKRTCIVDAFEEEEDTSKSSKIQKSASPQGENDTIDGFEFDDTAASESLPQNDGKSASSPGDPNLVPTSQASNKENLGQDGGRPPIVPEASQVPVLEGLVQDKTLLVSPTKVVAFEPSSNQACRDTGLKDKGVSDNLCSPNATSDLAVIVEKDQVVQTQEVTEDVASSPTENPVYPTLRATTPEIQPMPLVSTVGPSLVSSPSSVNGTRILLTNSDSHIQAKSSSEELDQLMYEVRSASQSFKSLTVIHESSVPFTFLQFSGETQDEVNKFFGFLKIPFDDLVTNRSTEFTACIEKLVQRQVFPLKEQIVLENFSTSLNDTFSLFRYYKEEICQKQSLINSLSNISTKLVTMHDSLLTLKSRLATINQEERELLLRLDQLRSKKKALLAEKDQHSQDFKRLSEEGRGVSVQVSAARADLQRNSLRRDELLVKWDTFSSFFMYARP